MRGGIENKTRAGKGSLAEKAAPGRLRLSVAAAVIAAAAAAAAAAAVVAAFLVMGFCFLCI